MEAGNGKREAGTDRRAIRSYEDLEVYQRAMDLLVPLHTYVLTFPDYERFELASQLRRASKAIPANIAEGYGKKTSSKEFKAYLNHALGSANEVIVHIRIAERLGYVAARRDRRTRGGLHNPGQTTVQADADVANLRDGGAEGSSRFSRPASRIKSTGPARTIRSLV